MRKCAFYVLSTLRFCFLPGRGMLLLSHFPCVVPLQARTFHFNLQLKLEVQCKAQGEDFSSLYDRSSRHVRNLTLFGKCNILSFAPQGKQAQTKKASQKVRFTHYLEWCRLLKNAVFPLLQSNRLLSARVWHFWLHKSFTGNQHFCNFHKLLIALKW